MINKVNLGRIYYWSPWLGCFKISEACQNCFIRNLNRFELSKNFNKDFSKYPEGSYVICSLQTDFFLEEADAYREQAWEIIHNNPHLIFVLITKRIERVKATLPRDWGEGYENVVITVTVENQKRADERIPILLSIPAKHKWLTCSPLLEDINIENYLKTKQIEHIECCGELGAPDRVRELRYEWVEHLSQQCKENNVRFSFMKIGEKFLYNGELLLERATCYHSPIADSLNLCNDIPLHFNLKEKTLP